MNSEYIIIDHNSIFPPEYVTILKWWKSHKTIYLCINDKESLIDSEWDYVIKEHNFVDIIIIKKEDIIDILYEKAHDGIIMFTEDETMKDYIHYQSKNVKSYYKTCDPFKSVNVCICNTGIFEYPFECIYDDNFDLYWKTDNKSIEQLHKEFCEKYIDQ